MTKVLIVVEDPKDWRPYYPSENVVAAQDYLFGEGRDAPPRSQVINLCRSFKYLSTGYYCSLLAEARGHRVIPTVRTINDLSRKSIYSLETENLDELLGRILRKAPAPNGERFTLDIFFGKTDRPELAELARQIFETFTCPLLQIEFRHREEWQITNVQVGSVHKLTEPMEDLFASALDSFSRHVWRQQRARKRYRYDLAILNNPEEKLPPSNGRALRNFVRVGKSLGIDAELIEKRDYARLAEYDALFIRETTAISNHTYRFAKKAESEGMVVIDDPNSIVRCTNKVYLADLLKTNNIATPKTVILRKRDLRDVAALEEYLGYPMVLKIPDGSFSRGVSKVQDRSALQTHAVALFKRTDLILAQEYLYTEYDWRIGVLNKKPIFACQYLMAKGHWQIVQHGPQGKFKSGGFKTYPTAEAPSDVVKLGVKAASLIGDGLYGVDIKQGDGRVCVIEVNDNPNLDAGVEDAYLKDDLYRVVLEDFVRRLEQRGRGG